MGTRMKSEKGLRNECFVIMPFCDPYDRYYEEVIAPAVKAADLTPQRGDSLFRSTPIIEEIWRMILDASILLVGFTRFGGRFNYAA